MKAMLETSYSVMVVVLVGLVNVVVGLSAAGALAVVENAFEVLMVLVQMRVSNVHERCKCHHVPVENWLLFPKDTHHQP